MGLFLPLKGVLDVQNNGLIGAVSVAGGIAHTFTIPQDASNIVLKFTASTVGGGVSAVLQTTDDGGVTWYDVSRTSIVSNTAGETLAQFLTAGTSGTGMATAINGFPTASILTVGIGNAAASTVAQRQTTGMPFLSTIGRAFIRIDAAVDTANSVRTRVYVNGQDQAT